MKHIIAAHAQKPGCHIADGIIPHMPHMNLARRIRKHLKHIVFLFGLILGHLKDLIPFPYLLPLLFYLFMLVSLLHKSPLNCH
jgi:hypothetical protein